ncbi:MAG TPA: hypothetical protein VF763_05365 [Candidatus Limnocylindrales bacterium]
MLSLLRAISHVPSAPLMPVAAGRPRLAPVLVAALLTALVWPMGAVASLAIETSQATLASNSFTGGAWALYLHNIPAGPTTAQFNLPMDTTAPTATTLSNYDTNCDSSTGRLIRVGTGLPTESTTCYYANWRTTAYATARALAGTVTLRIWAIRTGTNGTAPTLQGYLRDYNPGTNAYVELGTANVTVSATSQTQYVLTWTLAATIPAGHQLELKLVAPSGNRDVIVAYDTTTYTSRLVLLQQPAS